MYDTHYDLLSFILMFKNDFKFLQNLCSQVYNEDNIHGGIINSFYAPIEEMKNEIGIFDFNVVEHFKLCNKIIDENNLFPDKNKILFAIEGCDHVDIDNIEELYNLGLRCIIPIYSHNNRYGGGCWEDQTTGLTDAGKEFITKAIELGIVIDISHSNDTTANDILDLLMELKNTHPNLIVMASHSNSRALCNHPRNLTDELLLKLKELNGTVGVVALKTFSIKSDNPNENYDKAYADQLKYIINLIGIDNVCIASDNMDYPYIPEDTNNCMYEINSFASKIKEVLKEHGFTDEEIKKLTITNFESKILNNIYSTN